MVVEDQQLLVLVVQVTRLIVLLDVDEQFVALWAAVAPCLLMTCRYRGVVAGRCYFCRGVTEVGRGATRIYAACMLY